MYEKLDRLRVDVTRCKERIEADKRKLVIAENRLKKAEEEQILADVYALKITPEQLAELIPIVKAGKLADVLESVNKDSMDEEELEIMKLIEEDEKNEA